MKAAATRNGKPATAGLDREISEAIQDFARRCQVRDRQTICRKGLNVSECYALETIARSADLGVTELAAILGLDKSNAGRVVAALDEKKLVRVLPHPRHHRAKLLQVTAAGERLLASIHAEIEAEHQAILERFTSAERKAFLEVLSALNSRCAPKPI